MLHFVHLNQKYSKQNSFLHKAELERMYPSDTEALSFTPTENHLCHKATLGCQLRCGPHPMLIVISGKIPPALGCSRASPALPNWNTGLQTVMGMRICGVLECFPLLGKSYREHFYDQRQRKTKREGGEERSVLKFRSVKEITLCSHSGESSWLTDHCVD